VAALSIALLVSPNYLDKRDLVTRRLISLDAVTGKRIWQRDVSSTPPEGKFGRNSHATPTPVADDGLIAAAFGPVVATFDATGRRLWSVEFPNWTENSLYGAGSSPVIDAGVVFLSMDREYNGRQPSRVSAYSMATGRELWTRTPQFAHDSYVTPVIYDEGERKLLVTVTSRQITAYETATGEVVWVLKTPVSTPIPTPVIVDDRLYVTGGRGGSAYTAAYQLGQGAPPRELWRTQQSPADVSSPVVYDGKLFTITSIGVMVCYDADTGRILWRHRVGSGLGVFYASLVAASGKVYAVRSNGTTYVIAAEDTFRLIAESPLQEEVFASPAVAAGCLLVRTASALYCIGSERQP
jgi:outer membrane protein assembly factor BamB